MRRAIRGGMTYPIVILVALVAVGIALMVFVIPKLVEVFEGFDVELPLMTRVLIATSNFIQNYWYIVIVMVAVGIFSIVSLLRVRSIKQVVLHGLLYAP